MIVRKILLIKSLLLLSLFSACSVAQVNCEVENKALRAMPPSKVKFERTDGSVFEIEVRTADNSYTRAQGFQRVCREGIAAKPILFIFNSEVVPHFHMNNVVASIDIAFIKKNGQIDSIQAMAPYSLVSTSRPLYSPKGPVVAAIEAHPNFYSKNRLAGSTVSWQR